MLPFRINRSHRSAVLAVVSFVVSLPPIASGQQKTLYLTFDDGPIKGTAEVLEVLKGANAKATFFLVGGNQSAAGGAEKQKELLKMILDARHKVGNHTYTHLPKKEDKYVQAYSNPMTSPQRDAFQKNYNDNLTHFRNLLGAATPFGFKIARLPGDGGIVPSLKYLRDETEKAPLSMKHYGWHFEFAPNGKFDWVPNKDWQGITGVAASATTLPGAGNIVLFHDEHWAGNAQVALRKIVELLIAKQYTFQLLAD